MSRSLTLLVLAACTNPNGSVTDGTDTAIPLTPPFETVERVFDWTNDFQTEAKFHVPEDAIGLVWAFHGNGGGLPTVQRVEWLVLYNQLVQRRIGVVITKSLDRRTGSWSLADQDELVGIFDSMVNQWGAVRPDIPHGVIGFSGGSQMAKIFEDLAVREAWDFRVAAVHQGTAQMTAVPTFYVGSENDDLGRDASFYESEGLVDVCMAATGDCRLREGVEITLDPRRFMRINDVDETRSREYFTEMMTVGLVDGEGNRLVDIDDKVALHDMLDRYNDTSRFGSAITRAIGQLRVVWATHRLSSEFAREEAEFFRTHLEPPR